MLMLLSDFQSARSTDDFFTGMGMVQYGITPAFREHDKFTDFLDLTGDGFACGGAKPGRKYYWSSSPLSSGEMTTKEPLPWRLTRNSVCSFA